MASGKASKKRRRLLATITPENKRDMKERIYQLGKIRTDRIAEITRTERAEKEKVVTKYTAEKENVRREYERNRAAVIQQFEEQWGKDAVQEVLA